MRKQLDITGIRYGSLVAIKRVKVGSTVYWECKCDCGNTSLVRTNNLRNGTIRSCGCSHEANDLSGKRFGKLVALEKTHINGKAMWKCQCDCGKTTFVSRQNLRYGNTKSCGCQRLSGLHQFIDHTGEIHGKLTVLERDYEEQKSRESTAAFWKCKCECGRIITISSSAVRVQKSCGYKDCVGFKPKAKDISGRRFNNLTVIKRDVEYQLNKGYKNPYWLCRCDCGNITRVKGYYLWKNLVKSCGCIQKSKKSTVDKQKYSTI